MISKFFMWFTCFFGILAVFGIYLGYSHLIYPETAVLAILVSSLFSYVIVKKIKSDNNEKIVHMRYISVILLAIIAFDIYVSMPYMVYPHSYIDFGLNVAQGRLVAQTHGFPSFSHVYPNVYFGVFAIFDSVIPYAYSLSSAIAIILQVMTAFTIFLIGKEIFDERVGIVASFLYGFSLIGIMLLEQGYLPQNFATFFFASSIYLLILSSKDRSYYLPMALSLVGLLSYPHYFAVIFFTIIIYFRRHVLPLLLALGIMSLEIIGIIAYYLTHVTTLAYSFVMAGGIIVPNIFVLFVFLPALAGFLSAGIKRKNCPIACSTYVISALICLFLVFFLINNYIYTWRVQDIKQLYIVVKLTYLLLIPVSLFAAFYIVKIGIRWTFFVLIFSILYFAYFANYITILPQKNNLPNEMYYTSEILSELAKNNRVGFDSCMLQDSWTDPWIYDTLYGKKDNYTDFSKAEFGFLLQSHFYLDAGEDHYRFGDSGKIYNSGKNVSYFVTTCNYSSDYEDDNYYSLGRLRIYNLSSV